MPIVKINPEQEDEPQGDGARDIDLPIIPFPLKQVPTRKTTNAPNQFGDRGAKQSDSMKLSSAKRGFCSMPKATATTETMMICLDHAWCMPFTHAVNEVLVRLIARKMY